MWFSISLHLLLKNRFRGSTVVWSCASLFDQHIWWKKLQAQPAGWVLAYNYISRKHCLESSIKARAKVVACIAAPTMTFVNALLIWFRGETALTQSLWIPVCVLCTVEEHFLVIHIYFCFPPEHIKPEHPIRSVFHSVEMLNYFSFHFLPDFISVSALGNQTCRHCP